MSRRIQEHLDRHISGWSLALLPGNLTELRRAQLVWFLWRCCCHDAIENGYGETGTVSDRLADIFEMIKFFNDDDWNQHSDRLQPARLENAVVVGLIEQGLAIADEAGVRDNVCGQIVPAANLGFELPACRSEIRDALTYLLVDDGEALRSPNAG